MKFRLNPINLLNPNDANSEQRPNLPDKLRRHVVSWKSTLTTRTAIGITVAVVIVVFCVVKFGHHTDTLMLRRTPYPPIARSPVRQFLYHALHKAGSTKTRYSLKQFCKTHNLRCLDEEQLCGGMIGQAPLYKLNDCFDDIEEHGHLLERDRTTGEMMVTKTEQCKTFLSYNSLCCPFYGDFIKNGIDAVVDHFPLHLGENRQFLSQVLPRDAFRFTIMREPVKQFLSWHKHFTDLNENDPTGAPQSLLVPPLGKCIDMFYSVAKANGLTHVIPPIYIPAYEKLTNSQAKELGWSPRRGWDVDQIMDYLEQLDFVGITDHLEDTWTVLRSMLGWDNGYFNTTTITNVVVTYEDKGNWKDTFEWAAKAEQLLEEGQRTKIRFFQDVDLMLYERAVERFFELQQRYKEARDGIKNV